ncbi:MAG: FAD:protein FMN transferase [Chloroflexota bacterium]
MTQSSGLTRRQFIRITASAGALLAGGIGLGLASTGKSAVRVEETRYLLGSIANLTVISREPNSARRAIQAAFDRMTALEDVFSRFRPHSQLSRLNADGGIKDLDRELYEVVSKAIDFGRMTGGAFDITVEPVLQLYRNASKTGIWPDATRVRAAREYVDYREITVTPDSIRLNKPGMAVTLDGIAKGYIIDAGTDVLAKYGFEQIMIELGGDLQTRGDAGLRPWQVSIRRPVDDLSAQGSLIAQLEDTALATSGDYLFTFTPDRQLHHIIDPENGLSPDELSSASVIAPTACEADAFSTALMVMGARNGLTLIAHLAGVEALVITKQGELLQTEGFPLR